MYGDENNCFEWGNPDSERQMSHVPFNFWMLAFTYMSNICQHVYYIEPPFCNKFLLSLNLMKYQTKYFILIAF